MLENPIAGPMEISPIDRNGRSKMLCAPNEQFHRFQFNLRVLIRERECLPLDFIESLDLVCAKFHGPMRRYVRFWLLCYCSAKTYGEMEEALGDDALDCRFHCRDAAQALYDYAKVGGFTSDDFEPMQGVPWFKSLLNKLIAEGPSSPVWPPQIVYPHEYAFIDDFQFAELRYEPSLHRRTNWCSSDEPLTAPF